MTESEPGWGRPWKVAEAPFWTPPPEHPNDPRRLQHLLIEAAEAFLECTGDTAKELVAGEPWVEAACILSPALREEFGEPDE